MKKCKLTDEQFSKLLGLARFYRREAKKCLKAESYLSGCVMIGAALEASLVGMCHLYRDEIPGAFVPRGRRGKPKELLDWSFFQLLRVTRECGWLPSRLKLNEEWDQKKAHIGDWAIILKDWRNLVHPSRYLRDLPQGRMTKRRLEMAFEIFADAAQHLEHKVLKSLKATIEEEEKRLAGAPLPK